MKRSRKLILACTLAAAAVTALALPARAQRGPCAEDRSKFCKGVKRAGGQMQACLEEHKSELSDACKAHLEKMKAEGRPKRTGQRTPRAKAQEMRQACAAEISKHCSDVRPGRRRLAECLRSHESDLSAECKSALPKK